MQKKGNINFVLVGARATGKTVYLSSLYLNEKSVTAQDERTIKYLKPLSEILLTGEYPSATAGNLHELMFNYKDEKFSTSIQIDDVDGYFIETLSEKDKNTQNERDRLIQNMKLSEGLIFFFPYQKDFNEKAIKEFNYQIDTIITKLRDIYADRSLIPIPVVIAVSKWDDSPYYQKENENQEALTYINSHKFLCLAKEKIELNFNLVHIVPISAIGQNINDLKPYNLNKPLKIFLEETYRNWIEKINKLQDNKEELLSFLSKVDFDMKTYNNGKYHELYKRLEEEYALKILKEVNSFKNIKEYELFEEKNRVIINSLLIKNREKLLKVKKRLSKNQKVKRFSGFTLVSSFVAITVLTLLAWNADKLLIKNETELFADIVTEYNNNNYEDAESDIEDYLSEYSNTVNLEHKQKILNFKSHIQKSTLLDEIQNIVADKNFDNPDRIDDILTSMNKLGINNKKMKSELLEVKNRIYKNQSYSDFIEQLKQKEFNEALYKVQTDWKDDYLDKNQIVVHKILNKALNIKVKKLLDDISDINDLDEFNNLVHILNSIEKLKSNTFITKINYKASLSSENENILKDKWEEYEKYNSAFKDGILSTYISFGAEYEDNEPLGFNCESEKEIILTIDTTTYHYNDYYSCVKRKMSWICIQIFHDTSYSVNVIEEDLIENDKYSNSFSLKKNDLIKLVNHETIKKSIGRGYYIEIGDKE